MKKLDGTQNGYIIEDSSTNDQWHEILKDYGDVRCIICNTNTSKYFKIPLISYGRSNITINNKIPDMIVYINRVT